MPSNARSGLRRKIWTAFILQAAAISFAAVLGVYGASAVLKHLLIERALEQEAAHYWQRVAEHPGADLPDTFNLAGYLRGAGRPAHGVPELLRPLEPGYHSLPRSAGGALVRVEDGPQGQRLYLLFKQDQVDSLAFWFGMAPLALVLAVIYVIAFVTYRTSKRLVSPVIWLAGKVQRWDPKHPDASALEAANLPADVEGEALVLASSLHDFASRIGQFVERERNFTRDASHELRTPLAVIRVAGDMLATDDGLSPSARRALERIRGAGRDMETLIETFLILAREGETDLPDEDFSVSSVVREEIEKAQPLLGDRPVELQFECSRDVRLRAPPRVLSVLVGNLLRNACHYTDAGKVSVVVGDGRIEVRDTGIGMTEQELAEAFTPFFRGGDRSREGQGVGLSIVRRLSERYGWPVELSSHPGAGTVATVHFPGAVHG